MGYRKKPDYENNPGLMSKGRLAWVQVYFGQFVIWADFKKKDGQETDEVGDLKLVYPIPQRPPVTWNLTALTEEELEAVKSIWDTAYEWALPIVQQRDKEAKDAFEAGDDSHSRIYRQVPLVVYRTRPQSSDSEGVQHGSEDAASVSQPDGDQSSGLRVSSAGVAERDEDELRTQDDGATPD